MIAGSAAHEEPRILEVPLPFLLARKRARRDPKPTCVPRGKGVAVQHGEEVPRIHGSETRHRLRRDRRAQEGGDGRRVAQRRRQDLQPRGKVERGVAAAVLAAHRPVGVDEVLDERDRAAETLEQHRVTGALPQPREEEGRVDLVAGVSTPYSS